MKKAIILHLIFFSWIPYAFAFNCDDPITQSELNYCNEEAYKETDKKLNQIYQKLLKCMEEEHAALLKKSQNLWIKYRDADCEFRSFEFRTGSIFPLTLSSCLIDKTEDRIKELERILQSPLDWGIVCSKNNENCNLSEQW